MKSYDFMFIYEGKNRELESVCLLAYELERRGYSVNIVETWHSIFYMEKPSKAKVAICFALYNEKTLNYIKTFVNECYKFVNMQWEQIFSNGDVDDIESNNNISRGITGIACEACHICWGINNYNRLIEYYKVKPQNVRVVGHVALDFLREDFSGFYTSKRDLLKKYNISEVNKICLFISSFAYVGLPETILNSNLYQNQGRDVNEFASISCNSQKIVLDWFEKMLGENDTYSVIYRPHPAENDNPRLKKLSQKYSNFHVISELSVKQWILISDKIYTWYSTAISEVYMARKSCGILRPIELPYKQDIELYNEADFLDSYKAFIDNFKMDRSFPIEDKVFQKYYDIDVVPSYVKLCNFLEDVYRNDSYVVPVKYDKPISEFKRLRHNIYMGIMKTAIGRRVLKIVLPKRMKNVNEEEYLYNIRLSKANYASKKEIRKLKKKIGAIINV